MPVVTTDTGTRIAWPLQPEQLRPRDVRNAFEIMAYTGENGGGKTTAAVFDALPFLAAGRPIVSTVRILDPFTREPHKLWVPLDDYRLLLDVEFCVVIADEVTGMAGARDHQAFPSDVLNRSQQFRKADVIFKWTTPDWRNADAGIRRVTKGLTVCRGFAPVETREVSPDGIPRLWRNRRGHSWKTYDARNFDEWTTAKERSPSKAHRIRPRCRQIIWGPGTVAREMFDTYQQALTLGVVSEGGTCFDCGGARRRKACRCPGSGDSPDLLPLLADDGCCTACDKPRKASRTCECAPEIDRSPSPGMLQWEQITAERRARAAERAVSEAAALLEFPETDDTPGVLIDTNDA